MNKEKSVILLSGGLDSAVALACAHEETHIVSALTFDYGQRAARQELQAAQLMAQKYGISHNSIDLPWLKEITKTALVNTAKNIPQLKETQLNEAAGLNLESALAVWVPNRNGVFINIAAAFAEAYDVPTIITGFNFEEAQTFSDNSADFIKAANGALSFSTQNLVEVKSYISELSKTEIVALGKKKKAPLQCVWSCYEGGKKHCWQCESCQRLKRALSAHDLYNWFIKENIFS